jgi:uncharacterized protein (TIGR04255 family)
MTSKTDYPGKLSSKPLVEAIFEMRWELTEKDGYQVDPDFPVFVGKYFEKIGEEYPHREDLSICQISDQHSPHTARHRFRRKKDGWPLTQIGPGILTVNDTEGYDWDGFSSNISDTVKHTFAAYSGKPKPIKVSLRYINTIPFYPKKSDILKTLKEKLKIDISFEDSVLEKVGVKNHHQNFGFFSSLPSTDGKLLLIQNYRLGKHERKQVLFWDITVQANEGKVPKTAAAVNKWIEKAHDLLRDWFFYHSEGQLLKKFQQK